MAIVSDVVVFVRDQELWMAKEFIPYAARKRGPDWVAFVRVSFAYTLDEAARVLAMHQPVPPRRVGKNTVQNLLADPEAHAHGKLALAQADPEVVEFYRGKLIDDDFYERKNSDPDAKPKYYPPDADKTGWTRQWAASFPYRLDQAARAIAMLHPERPSKFGFRTCRAALRQAASQGLTGDKVTRARLPKESADMVGFYRDKLIEFEIFPPEARQTS